MTINILIRQELLTEFCERRPIQRLALLGSVLRGEFSDESDIDFLVEFLPDAHIDLFDMVEMESELTDIMGRPVDLRTSAELSRYFRQDVLNSAQTIYER
jgi:predicted nucleotidyltransferase